jgi:hypothetical protein
MTAEPLPPPAPRDSHARATPARRPRTNGELVPEHQSHRDMALYPQFISDGIAAARRRHSAVDHVTARRLSLMLLSESKDPQFSRALARFADDGAITEQLTQSLRRYAHRQDHPHQEQSWTLWDYVAARGTDFGPVCTDFSALCDEADQADTARTASEPSRAAADPAQPWEATHPSQLRRAPRRNYPEIMFTLWASDWAKERYPEDRANLYDALRALNGEDTGPAPATNLHSPAGWGLASLTPKEWAGIEAENMDEDPWELYHWERDHEIE